ncbi:hypothetical protein phiL_123 [Escherichia phage LAMP]|uniref:Uncharacterized protein n=1 Tax=Escherichia phage LAMP TaxID=2065191 RepID=A0A2I6PD70_9CAUD|nr:hypothetical protein phiL_123 [Escherichia phage LAMP]
MLTTHTTIYRNLVNGQHYRLSKKYGVEYRCMLTGEWYPSPMKIETLEREAVRYIITQETTLGRVLRKLGLRK